MLTNDMRLVKAAQDGDHKAFTSLVRAHGPAAHHFVLKLVRNTEDAREIVQESLLKAYLHLSQFQGEARFSTWLGRIALNESLMRMRRRPAHEPISLDDQVTTFDEPSLASRIEDRRPGPEGLCQRRELRRVLIGTILTLSPRYRNVFMLRHVQECSTRETAEILGLSVTAVKTRLRRAREELRRRLSPFYESGYRDRPPERHRGSCKPRSAMDGAKTLPSRREVAA